MHRRRSKSKSPKTKQKRYRGSEDPVVGSEDPVVKQYMEHAMPLLRDWINFPMSYTHIPYSQAVAAVYAAPTVEEPMYRPQVYDFEPKLITPAQPEVLEHYAPGSHVTRGSMIKNGYMCSEHSRVSITVAGISLLMSIDGLPDTPLQITLDSLVTIQYSVLPTKGGTPPPHPIEFSQFRDNPEECLKNAMEIAFSYIFTAARWHV